MHRRRVVKHRSAQSFTLGMLLALGCGSGVLAASKIGLPYVQVQPNTVDLQHLDRDVEIKAESRAAIEQRDVEIAAEVVPELVMFEIAPDAYSRRNRSGIDVYRDMNEDGFDDEPMPVIYAKADPALALPEAVVIPASRDTNYTHITAAERIVDPIARGEDKIFLQLSELPDAPGRPSSTPPKQRRFFSQGSDL